MDRKRIRLLITDLDNTLYDWVSAFVPALQAMVEVGAPHLGISEEQLLNELREVHQRHGNSEHPFALLETSSVMQRYGELRPDETPPALDEALHAFNRLRRARLKLYVGVRETLEVLARRGVPVVAYTDARAPNSLYRLEKLELLGLVARLYAPTPRLGAPKLARTVDALEPGFVHALPREDKKPNPATLLDICRDYGVQPEEVVYVGDSLTRDVLMARDAGVIAAWAKYGTEYDKAFWPQLVKITHWTAEDIEVDLALRERAHGIVPDVQLSCFADLLKHFDFDGR